MQRRNVLNATGAALVVALGGCTDERNHEGASTTDETTSTGATTFEKTVTTVETPTTVGPAETEYELGTFHEHAEWQFAVVSFELTKRFQTDDGESYEMPDGQKVGIAIIDVKNRASEKRGWSGVPLAAIFDGTAYEKQYGLEHPAFSDYIPMDELKGVETARQYAPSAYPVEPSETVTAWELFVLPEDTTRTETTVGFDDESNGRTSYPIRWTLK